MQERVKTIIDQLINEGFLCNMTLFTDHNIMLFMFSYSHVQLLLRHYLASFPVVTRLTWTVYSGLKLKTSGANTRWECHVA